MREESQEKTKKLSPLKWIPYSSKYILIAILILGFGLRAYKITGLPLYGDELTIVYDAYSVLKTGMDQTGESYPLTFKMGAGRPPGYVYGSIPFVAMFGPTEWGVRGLSLASSLGIIVLIYLLGKKLFNEKVGLWSSFLMSISLWDIYLSRGGFEAHFALFLAMSGVLLFLHNKYIPMAFAFGLAVFTYPTFKLTIPLIILSLTFYIGLRKIFQNKSYIIALIILAIFAIVSLNETSKGVSEERFLKANVFADHNTKEDVIQKINEQRTLSSLPENIKPLLYNKPLAFTRILFESYMENLSPTFLYLRGDRNPRTNPGEWGMFYLAEIALLFIGLYHLVRNDKKNLLLLAFWILITPLATMFLGQTHALRNNFMLPAFILISAYALANLSIKMKSLVLGLMFVQLVYVLVTLYTYAPYKFGSFWSKEAKLKSLAAIEESKSLQVILSTKIDNIEYAYPVYAKIDPKIVISQYGKFPKIYSNVIIINE